MTDDPGVMGNLPRSRPGRRSEKRDGANRSSGAGARAASSGGAKRAAAGGAKRASTDRAKRATAARSATRAGSKQRAKAGAAKAGAPARDPRMPRPPTKSAPRGPDPVGDAVRVAAKVAGTGIGIAAGVLRRLPRP